MTSRCHLLYNTLSMTPFLMSKTLKDKEAEAYFITSTENRLYPCARDSFKVMREREKPFRTCNEVFTRKLRRLLTFIG